jgi:hypothetical protein
MQNEIFRPEIVSAETFLELTFLLDQKSNKKVKAIFQPEFFAKLSKYKTPLTKNSGSHKIAVCQRTVQDVN